MDYQLKLDWERGVVFQLCRPLQGGNYQVFCDNFSTAGLFDELLQQNIYACGTAQIDWRGFPETLKKVAIKDRGQHESCQRGNLVATVWKDKKDVKMLSTMCDPCSSQTGEKPEGWRQSHNTMSSCGSKYTGGVDQGDQLRQYYRIRTKCVKNSSIYLVFS